MGKKAVYALHHSKQNSGDQACLLNSVKLKPPLERAEKQTAT
jgi:hypothetical protein